MKFPMRRLLLAAILIVATVGCAKKQVVTPPEPPPAPPSGTQTQPPAQQPPAETPPTPRAQLGSSDFQPVYFDYDAYGLNEQAKGALDHNTRLLRDNSGVSITIEGHCDERGTAEYNQALGERRAQAARDYLAAAGIEGGRIQILSYGKERPFENGHDESAWARNRRAHFVTR